MNYRLGVDGVQFLGSLGSRQYKKVKKLVTGNWDGLAYTRSEWKFQKWPNFTEKDRELAEKIKSECVGKKGCALIRQGEGRKKEETYVSKFNYSDWKSTGPFPLEDPYALICTSYDKGYKTKISYFKSDDTIRKYLAQEGKNGACTEGATILELHASQKAAPVKKNRTLHWDKIEFFKVEDGV